MNLNELAVENYLRNKQYILRESRPGDYTDQELHETAVEWTLEDMAHEIDEFLQEELDKQNS